MDQVEDGNQRPKLHRGEDAAKGGVVPAQNCELGGGEDHERMGHHRMESQEYSSQAGQ